MPYKDPNKQREHHKKRARDWLDFLASLKTGKSCTDCGIVYPFYVMDWDHVKGTKNFGISRAINSRKNKKVIQEELLKCELVCSNCHRIRTYNRKQYVTGRPIKSML